MSVVIHHTTIKRSRGWININLVNINDPASITIEVYFLKFETVR